MNRVFGVAAVLAILSACTPAPDAPRSTPSANDASLIDASGIDASVATTAPDPLPLCMSDERQHGTTCCRTEMGDTVCRGPNIGTPCQRKGDCDLLCGCDDPRQRPPMQGGSPQGPADGTRGVTGTCMGQIVDGAWYCTIDESGVVGHFIRN